MLSKMNSPTCPLPCGLSLTAYLLGFNFLQSESYGLSPLTHLLLQPIPSYDVSYGLLQAYVTISYPGMFILRHISYGLLGMTVTRM